MNIHVCKQCGASFVYCRACVFRPIRYKDAGFCSKECYEASKNNVAVIEPVVEDAATAQIEEPIVENSDESSVDDVLPIEETVSVETIPMVEPTIKNETNTYKKKKNKYKVHE